MKNIVVRIIQLLRFAASICTQLVTNGSTDGNLILYYSHFDISSVFITGLCSSTIRSLYLQFVSVGK